MILFDNLVDGYRRFRAGAWKEQRNRWAELARGQSPNVMVIACSDSRVEPALIFDSNPGEIFVLRNVANLVPPFEPDGGRHGVSAAIEFAVTQLKVKEIVVLGHGACGGCRAALSQDFRNAVPGEGGFIDRWIALLDDARTRVVATHGDHLSSAALNAMEHESVKISLANLRTFPFVAKAEAEGNLALRGAWFAIDEGRLHLLDEIAGDFLAVT